MNEKLVKIGLSIDYPIEWDMEMILRDLMQNFFDAIGHERFAEDFIYNVSGTEEVDCIMAAKGHSFSYEWLVSIGGSTKEPGENIGFYGEGFKMCMLRLIQLSIVECTMESEEWILRPCVYYEKVSGNRVGMLGYMVSERADDGNTRLTIKGIPSKYRYLFHEISFKDDMDRFLKKYPRRSDSQLARKICAESEYRYVINKWIKFRRFKEEEPDFYGVDE